MTQVQLTEKEQAIRAILAQYPELGIKKAAAPAKQVITVNKNKGLFFKHPDFQLWSKDKNKFYTAGINMDMKIAKELFNNVELLKELRDFVNDDEKQARIFTEKSEKAQA